MEDTREILIQGLLDGVGPELRVHPRRLVVAATYISVNTFVHELRYRDAYEM